MKQVPPLDAAWLALESRDTPMHVGGLFEFSLPDDALDDYLSREAVRLREARTIPPPWNLKLVEGPVIGNRLPLMREDRDIDLDYHVRHSALPNPGGQRELGILVSRLHSHQLDLHRPLWEMHLIEGLEDNRFAIYMKMHHSLIDGISGMRLILRALSPDPSSRDTPAFWTVGAGERPRSERDSEGLGGRARNGVDALRGLSRAALDLGRAADRRQRRCRRPTGRPTRRSGASSPGSGASPPSSTRWRSSRSSRRRPTARSTTSSSTCAAPPCAATCPSTRRCPTAP